MVTTIGQIIVNNTLPKKYRDYNRILDKGAIEDLLAQIALNDPSEYKDASAKLMRVGNQASFDGGTTLRLSDVASPIDRSALFDAIDKQENRIRSLKTLTNKEKAALIDDLYDQAYSAIKDDTYKAGISKNNPLAMQVKSKARGNQDQLSAMISTPGIYQDSKGNNVRMFIKHSYAEGLSPAELWAGSYGARLGVVSSKFATRKGGELGKLLSSASIDEVVTEDDCGTTSGLPVKADDPDNLGCVLACPVAGFKSGTIITKEVLSAIKNKGVDDIVVRSPVTCGSKDGVCSKCCGIRENGKFPEIGYNLGVNAASALAERIAQGALNTKHSGKKLKGRGHYQGFDMIKSMVTVPKTYNDAAVVASLDGKVEKIEDAPQGGKYIYIDGTSHYVAPGYDILVKEGDALEAGDQLSDGVINPVDAVKYKGLGEGRRYFTNRFTQAFRDSGYGVSRRNVEAVARTLMDDVSIDSEDAEGQMLPGDVVSYSRWSFGYKPRKDSIIGTPNSLVGKYLEQPAMHYTIGTRITKRVADDLKKHKINQIMANDNEVGVTPFMQSVVKSTGDTNDWMARLGTTYLKSRLIEDAQTGSISNAHSTNPIPGIAKGIEFGNYFDPGVHRSGGFTY